MVSKAERNEKAKLYTKKYLQRIKEDPVRYAEYKKRQKELRVARLERIKSDPAAYEEYKNKRRIYQKRYKDKLKQSESNYKEYSQLQKLRVKKGNTLNRSYRNEQCKQNRDKFKEDSRDYMREYMQKYRKNNVNNINSSERLRGLNYRFKKRIGVNMLNIDDFLIDKNKTKSKFLEDTFSNKNPLNEVSLCSVFAGDYSREYRIFIKNELTDSTEVGYTDYQAAKIYIKKLDINMMTKTVIHELTHVWMYENGHNQIDKSFTNEDVCEICSNSYLFIHDCLKLFYNSLLYAYDLYKLDEE